MVDDLGAPVERFEIQVRRPADAQRQDARGDPFVGKDGSFDLPSLARGEWLLTASRPTGTRSSGATVQVPWAGEDLVIVLPRDASVSGFVLARDESPVAEAEVYVEYPWERTERFGGRFDTPPRARSGADGRFAIDAAQPGAFRVMAAREGYCDSEWVESTVDPGRRVELTLHVRQGGRVVGVVDPSQGEIAHREIGLFNLRGTIGWRTTHSDEAGAFAIENVVPQKYAIELRPAGYPDRVSGLGMPGTRKQIAVRDGQTTEVVLGADRDAIHVLGLVLREGRPAAGLNVYAESLTGTEDPAQQPWTSASGTFELDVDGPGEYSFQVEGREGSSAWFQRRIEGRSPVELTLEVPGGTISGKILSPAGEPLGYVPVTVVRAAEPDADACRTFGERNRRAKTDANGAFEFGLLPPGTYVLRTPDGFRGDAPPPRTPFGRVVITNLRVGAAPLEPLVIRLPPEGHISGQVVDSAGAPVVGAAIFVYDAAGVCLTASPEWTPSTYSETTTDVTGAFHVDSIAAGTYTVVALKKDRRATSSPVQVIAGKTAEARIELPGGG